MPCAWLNILSPCLDLRWSFCSFPFFMLLSSLNWFLNLNPLWVWTLVSKALWINDVASYLLCFSFTNCGHQCHICTYWFHLRAYDLMLKGLKEPQAYSHELRTGRNSVTPGFLLFNWSSQLFCFGAFVTLSECWLRVIRFHSFIGCFTCFTLSRFSTCLKLMH